MTKEELLKEIKRAEDNLLAMLSIRESCGKNRYTERLVEHSKRHLYYLRKKLEKLEK